MTKTYKEQWELYRYTPIRPIRLNRTKTYTISGLGPKQVKALVAEVNDEYIENGEQNRYPKLVIDDHSAVRELTFSIAKGWSTSFDMTGVYFTGAFTPLTVDRYFYNLEDIEFYLEEELSETSINRLELLGYDVQDIYGNQGKYYNFEDNKVLRGKANDDKMTLIGYDAWSYLEWLVEGLEPDPEQVDDKEAEYNYTREEYLNNLSTAMTKICKESCLGSMAHNYVEDPRLGQWKSDILYYNEAIYRLNILESAIKHEKDKIAKELDKIINPEIEF